MSSFNVNNTQNTQNNAENDTPQPPVASSGQSAAPTPFPPVETGTAPTAVENVPPNPPIPTSTPGESAVSCETTWSGVMRQEVATRDLPTPEPKQGEKRVRPKNSGKVWYEKFTESLRGGHPKATRADTPEPFTPHIETIMDDLRRGAPTNGFVDDPSPCRPENVQLCRQRSQYYSDVFAVRESPQNVRNRVNQEAMIVVTITTSLSVSFP